MRLLFKQRIFSWLDSYDIFDEAQNVLFSVKGQLSFGKCLNIYDAYGSHIGTLKQKLFAFLPCFEIYEGDNYLGRVSKEFSFLKPRYNIDFCGQHIEGNFFECNYTVFDTVGQTVAIVSKQLLNFADTYSIEVFEPDDALSVLMLVLAIDAEKDNRNNN